ncbi:MAG: hypothetical protein LBJ01_00945 [Tannerella sp.]|jgi:hypothetical protein|nr:hypothetical protein [Tannerella sp.]
MKEREQAGRRKGSYLFARLDSGEEAVLFEGSNCIPFFWLMLLGQEDMDALCEPAGPCPADGTAQRNCRFELDKLRALIRAGDRRDYVAQYYASCLPLFDDWLYFMQITDFSDRKICLDTDEIRACYETSEDFVDSLRKAVACFDENRETWYESTVAATCGHECRNRTERSFSDFSEACREMSRQTAFSRFDKKIHLERKRSVGGKTARAVLIMLFVASLAAAVFFLCT